MLPFDKNENTLQKQPLKCITTSLVSSYIFFRRAEFEFALWMNRITFYLCSLMQDAIKLTQAFVIKITYTTHTHIHFIWAQRIMAAIHSIHTSNSDYILCLFNHYACSKSSRMSSFGNVHKFSFENVILGVNEYDSFLRFIFCDTAWSAEAL